MPLYGVGFEYMAVEYKKYLNEKGYEIEVPDSLWTYVSDK
jgi:hypothetical protein